jgi:hypothetical protein
MAKNPHLLLVNSGFSPFFALVSSLWLRFLMPCSGYNMRRKRETLAPFAILDSPVCASFKVVTDAFYRRPAAAKTALLLITGLLASDGYHRCC